MGQLFVLRRDKTLESQQTLTCWVVAVVPVSTTTLAPAAGNRFVVRALETLEAIRTLPIVIALARAGFQVCRRVIITAGKLQRGCVEWRRVEMLVRPA